MASYASERNSKAKRKSPDINVSVPIDQGQAQHQTPVGAVRKPKSRPPKLGDISNKVNKVKSKVRRKVKKAEEAKMDRVKLDLQKFPKREKRKVERKPKKPDSKQVRRPRTRVKQREVPRKNLPHRAESVERHRPEKKFKSRRTNSIDLNDKKQNVIRIDFSNENSILLVYESEHSDKSDEAFHEPEFQISSKEELHMKLDQPPIKKFVDIKSENSCDSYLNAVGHLVKLQAAFRSFLAQQIVLELFINSNAPQLSINQSSGSSKIHDSQSEEDLSLNDCLKAIETDYYNESLEDFKEQSNQPDVQREKPSGQSSYQKETGGFHSLGRGNDIAVNASPELKIDEHFVTEIEINSEHKQTHSFFTENDFEQQNDRDLIEKEEKTPDYDSEYSSEKYKERKSELEDEPVISKYEYSSSEESSPKEKHSLTQEYNPAKGDLDTGTPDHITKEKEENYPDPKDYALDDEEKNLLDEIKRQGFSNCESADEAEMPEERTGPIIESTPISFKHEKDLTYISPDPVGDFLHEQKSEIKKEELKSYSPRASPLEIQPSASQDMITESEESSLEVLTNAFEDTFLTINPSRLSEQIFEDLFLDVFLDFLIEIHSDLPKEQDSAPIVSLSLQDLIKDKTPTTNSDIFGVLAYSKEILVSARAVSSEVNGNLNRPYIRNPVKFLSIVQDSEIGTPKDPEIPPCILPVDLYLSIQKHRENEVEHIHNKAIFDAVNEALQKFRPYGADGTPMPWRNDTRRLFRTDTNIRKLENLVLLEIEKWITVEAGKIPCPELELPNREIDEELLFHIREERLTGMLAEELIEGDDPWVDYEFEETQVCLDISDMVLENLVNEGLLLLLPNQKLDH